MTAAPVRRISQRRAGFGCWETGAFDRSRSRKTSCAHRKTPNSCEFGYKCFTALRVGFTLTDMLVCLSVIAVLVALSFPAVQHAREGARRLSCQNNLRQMGVALHSFQSAYGAFPAASLRGEGARGDACDADEVEIEDNAGECTDFGAWTSVGLPFLGENAVAAAYHYEQPWSNLANRAAIGTHLGVFVCSSAPIEDRADRHFVSGAAPTDYGGISLVDRGVYTELFGVHDPGVDARRGVLAEHDASSPQMILDGLSNTIMVAECAGRPATYVLGQPMSARQFATCTHDEVVRLRGHFVVDDGVGWADPDASFSIEGVGLDGVEIYGAHMINATNAGEVYSFHNHGAQFLYADGGVRFHSTAIDPWVFVSLCTRAGGEVR